MIDIIIRDCGFGEWLPIIQETTSRRELYRGSRLPSAKAAFAKAVSVWENDETGNIVEFKQKQEQGAR